MAATPGPASEQTGGSLLDPLLEQIAILRHRQEAAQLALTFLAFGGGTGARKRFRSVMDIAARAAEAAPDMDDEARRQYKSFFEEIREAIDALEKRAEKETK